MPVVDAVYRGKQIYSGPYVDYGPDLNVIMRGMAYAAENWHELDSPSLFGDSRTHCTGIHRPLRKPADFARFAGSRVDVRMQNPDATGRRRFVGTLQRVDGSLATLEVDGLRVELDLGAMERARLVPDA